MLKNADCYILNCKFLVQTMQEQTIIIDAQMAKEKLQRAILRLEQAIFKQNNRIAAEEQTRVQLAKELDVYISGLETLLNPKK
jgi:hypothetical protein